MQAKKLNNMNKGKFIVLEGIDSCGKDTQQDMLQKHFPDFVYVRVLDEHKPKTKKLRDTIFNKDFRYEDKAEMLMFWADKVEMMKEIKEALDSGKNVICNRFELSHYAYQIYGKGHEELRAFSDFISHDIQKDYRPDMYILFDISPEESQRRKFQRTSATGKFEDYYDNAKKDFMERVISGYKTEITKYNHVIINGEQTREDVFSDVLKAIQTII